MDDEMDMDEKKGIGELVGENIWGEKIVGQQMK